MISRAQCSRGWAGAAGLAAVTVLAILLTACSGGGGSGGGTAATTIKAPSGLTYASADVVYTRGVPVAANPPTVGGDPVDSFSIAPALPVGLAIDVSTGEISGTPTVLLTETTYTITARNAGGETTTLVRITVNPRSPSNLIYASDRIETRVGTAIPNLDPTFDGDGGSFTAAPTLPSGLNLNSSTGTLSGVPTESIPTTTFVITLTNAAGAADFSIEIECRPEFDAFFDPLDSVDPDRWKSTVVGGGEVASLEGRAVRLESPAASDAAFLCYRRPIEASRDQIWRFCIRSVAPDGLLDLISIVSLPEGEEPGAGPEAQIASELRFALTPSDDGVEPTIRLRHDPAGDGAGRHWDGEPINAWTAAGDFAEAVQPIRQGAEADWYVVGFEIDGGSERFRLFAEHRQGFGIGDAEQGLKLVALTDWVALADFTAPMEQLWLVIGDRNTDAFAPEFHVEWVRLDDGPRIEGLSNGRQQNPTPYRLRYQSGLGTQLLPSGRGEILFEGGGEGEWDEGSHRKKHVIRDGDGTYYLFYEAFDDNNESAIGLATASALAGPWNVDDSNPVVPKSVLPNGGADYDVLSAPWVVKIDDEPNPQKLWRMIVAGELRDTSIHRLFLLTAPAPTGPWVLEPGSLVDGSVLAESSASDWKNDGNGDPLIWWDADAQLFRMICSGIREGFGWSVGTASSPDLLQWTESSANPIVAPDPDGIRSWTSVSGNSLTVTDASAFSEDSLVIIRNQSTNLSWGLSRVRRVSGNTLELYHRIEGVSGTDNNRTVALMGAGSITPHALVEEGSGYRLYVSVFQPFIRGLGAFGDCEFVASLTANDIEGPWEWDHRSSPHVPLDIWNADRSLENLAIPNEPVTIGP